MPDWPMNPKKACGWVEPSDTHLPQSHRPTPKIKGHYVHGHDDGSFGPTNIKRYPEIAAFAFAWWKQGPMVCVFRKLYL